MPVEHRSWSPVADWRALNAQMPRTVDVFDASHRFQPQTANTSATLALTWPRTLVRVNTTAGAVAHVLPDAATVPGFEVAVIKTGGGNALTVNGGAVSASARFISDGAVWHAG